MKKILLFFIVAAIGFYSGVMLVRPASRVVDTNRMETCLEIYKDYRGNPDQKKMVGDLATVSLHPKDFQQIIDRFIYYRTQKSSMNHAMKLLKAFRMGYEIDAKIFSISGIASESFRLDAEILAVFESNPELIKNAFEG